MELKWVILNLQNLNSSDSVIDEKDKTYLGSYIPKLMYGLVIELNYKAFDFSMDFNGQSGNKIYNGKNAVRPNLGNFEARVKTAGMVKAPAIRSRALLPVDLIMNLQAILLKMEASSV